MQPKPAGDVCSRCDRIERALRIDLDEVLKGNQSELDALIVRIDRQVDAFRIEGGKETSEDEGVASLKTAVRRYHDFRCHERARR
jgi:hypothetical protein